MKTSRMWNLFLMTAQMTSVISNKDFTYLTNLRSTNEQ